MRERRKSQFAGAPSGKGGEAALGGVGAPVKMELIVPNPKLKLLEQVREVMRLRHYSIRTEQCYCDWIRRYIKFHRMQSRAELSEGGGKVERKNLHGLLLPEGLLVLGHTKRDTLTLPKSARRKTPETRRQHHALFVPLK